MLTSPAQTRYGLVAAFASIAAVVHVLYHISPWGLVPWYVMTVLWGLLALDQGTRFVRAIVREEDAKSAQAPPAARPPSS